MTDPKWITGWSFNCFYVLAHHSFWPDSDNDHGSGFRSFFRKTSDYQNSEFWLGHTLQRIVCWPQFPPHRKGLRFMKIRVILTQWYQVLPVSQTATKPCGPAINPGPLRTDGKTEFVSLPWGLRWCFHLIENFNHLPRCTSHQGFLQQSSVSAVDFQRTLKAGIWSQWVFQFWNGTSVPFCNLASISHPREKKNI